MALSPSLAPRPAAEASRPETARSVDGTDGTDGAETPQGAPEGREERRDERGAGDGRRQSASVPAQPPVQRAAGTAGAAGTGSVGAGAAAAAQAAARGAAGAPAGRQHPGGAEEQATAASGRARPRGRAPRRPSGRERHDEKITVYVSAEELMDLEHTRLVLRGEHGLAVDRGRIVREAIAVVLADLEQRGEASILVRRLRGR
ncbi:hypothetical protein ACIBCA_04105 [Kitasatospora sp. NPDC051170]|uniref:hypothetical protein n=1 Tax=Kitasatospora sp. NPDC051170 TaxID=3364056 RepID=UPI00378E59D6